MVLQSTGQITIGDIAAEYSVSCANTSLRNLASCASLTVPDAMSEFYGLSDVSAPSVIQNTIDSVTTTSMRLRGRVTATGGENVTRGFYHGTSTTYSSNTKYSFAGTHGVGCYCCTRTGLSSGTAYRSNAFACNSAGETVSNQCSATTPNPVAPMVYCGGQVPAPPYFWGLFVPMLVGPLLDWVLPLL